MVSDNSHWRRWTSDWTRCNRRHRRASGRRCTKMQSRRPSAAAPHPAPLPTARRPLTRQSPPNLSSRPSKRLRKLESESPFLVESFRWSFNFQDQFWVSEWVELYFREDCCVLTSIRARASKLEYPRSHHFHCDLPIIKHVLLTLAKGEAFLSGYQQVIKSSNSY